MLNEMETAVEAELDKDFTANLRPLPLKAPPKGSVAEQVLGIAETIRNIHREIDALENDFGARLNALRKQLGSKS